MLFRQNDGRLLGATPGITCPGFDRDRHFVRAVLLASIRTWPELEGTPLPHCKCQVDKAIPFSKLLLSKASSGHRRRKPTCDEETLKPPPVLGHSYASGFHSSWRSLRRHRRLQ